MDDTLAQVQAKCALQLEMYQKCVENNPENWDKACVQQKRALTKCSEENVGIVKYVKQHCEEQIKAYDSCLTAKTAEPEQCLQQLKDLALCTEATAIAYREQELKQQQQDQQKQ
ncbi:hypothetical protein BCR43DRAFT_488605 [Syncephalastrum racemosum]|uniref:IMS import disulfide relay-system CHCH-CHCH-like Cx9C domain-containing protein n=1 Tax=Syncephalastrum racemosum TaxID=13706 RepID=A0A1X2HJ43_SYNRA|nr:hypothetical protein BCR43DRAFT_488605 [Syncephalastrum racemosum]